MTLARLLTRLVALSGTCLVVACGARATPALPVVPLPVAPPAQVAVPAVTPPAAPLVDPISALVETSEKLFARGQAELSLSLIHI